MGTNLVHDIFKRIGAVDGEANKDQVSLGIGERSQAVVFLLPGGIPKSKLDGLTGRRMRWVGDVVLKDCGDVFLDGC